MRASRRGLALRVRAARFAGPSVMLTLSHLVPMWSSDARQTFIPTRAPTIGLFALGCGLSIKSFYGLINKFLCVSAMPVYSKSTLFPRIVIPTNSFTC